MRVRVRISAGGRNNIGFRVRVVRVKMIEMWDIDRVGFRVDTQSSDANRPDLDFARTRARSPSGLGLV